MSNIRWYGMEQCLKPISISLQVSFYQGYIYIRLATICCLLVETHICLCTLLCRGSVRAGATGEFAPVDFQKTPFAPIDFP